MATVCLALGSFAVWLRVQILDTDNWTNTSSQIIANRTVQRALGTYVVGQLFGSVDVAGELGAVLPKQLAVAVAGELQGAAGGLAVKLLGEPGVQAAWTSANRAAHIELLEVLGGEGKVVSTRNGEVTLNLHPLVAELSQALSRRSVASALPSELRGLLGSDLQSVAHRLLAIVVPAQSGQLVVLRASQLRTAQHAAEAIRVLAIVLPAAALAMFALALVLARDWRKVVLRRIGWSLLVAGIAVLVARRLLEPVVVNALVPAADRAAGDVAWAIGTSVLRNLAIALIGAGVVIAIVAIPANLRWPAGLFRD